MEPRGSTDLETTSGGGTGAGSISLVACPFATLRGVATVEDLEVEFRRLDGGEVDGEGSGSEEGAEAAEAPNLASDVVSSGISFRTITAERFFRRSGT